MLLELNCFWKQGPCWESYSCLIPGRYSVHWLHSANKVRPGLWDVIQHFFSSDRYPVRLIKWLATRLGLTSGPLWFLEPPRSLWFLPCPVPGMVRVVSWTDGLWCPVGRVSGEQAALFAYIYIYIASIIFAYLVFPQRFAEFRDTTIYSCNLIAVYLVFLNIRPSMKCNYSNYHFWRRFRSTGLLQIYLRVRVCELQNPPRVQFLAGCVKLQRIDLH